MVPDTFLSPVTTGLPPAPEKIVVHLTIIRTEHDPEFIATIEKFVEDWHAGLEAVL